MINEIETFEFEEVFELAVSNCMTCELGPNGEPGACKAAEFCGITGCTGNCNLVGVLCGECADECGGMSCDEQ